jgi:flagellar hook-basal body complex protein FliE
MRVKIKGAAKIKVPMRDFIEKDHGESGAKEGMKIIREFINEITTAMHKIRREKQSNPKLDAEAKFNEIKKEMLQSLENKLKTANEKSKKFVQNQIEQFLEHESTDLRLAATGANFYNVSGRGAV